jgi:hypothetical protein
MNFGGPEAGFFWILDDFNGFWRSGGCIWILKILILVVLRLDLRGSLRGFGQKSALKAILQRFLIRNPPLNRYFGGIYEVFSQKSALKAIFTRFLVRNLLPRRYLRGFGGKAAFKAIFAMFLTRIETVSNNRTVSLEIDFRDFLLPGQK